MPDAYKTKQEARYDEEEKARKGREVNAKGVI